MKKQKIYLRLKRIDKLPSAKEKDPKNCKIITIRKT